MKMPVAVRLIEVLALITLLGILTGFSIFIVAAQRVAFILLLFITPLTYVIYGILYVSEKAMIATLATLLGVTNSIGDF